MKNVRWTVEFIFWAYYLLIMGRVLLSWFRPRRGTVLADRVAPVLYSLTEPLLAPTRRLLRPYQGGMPVDFSPLLLVVALSVVETLVLRFLRLAGL